MAWIRACGGASAAKKYIIKNGVSNIGDFLGYYTCATNITKYENASSSAYYSQQYCKMAITKPTADNKYLGLSINKVYGGADGAYYIFAASIGSSASFDITNYKKLVVEFNAAKNNTNLKLGLTQNNPSSGYTLSNYKVINATATEGSYVLEFDISALSGYYYLALFVHNSMPFNNTFTSSVNIKNMYMV